MSGTSKRKLVIEDNQRVLAPHLIQHLEEWHDQHPNKLPPAAYRSSIPKSPSITISRHGHEGTEIVRTIFLILQPMKYCMVVLEGASPEQDRFVGCLSSGSGYVFLKAWLGGENYEDEACAVTLYGGRKHLPPGKDNLWKEADRKRPARRASRGSRAYCPSPLRSRNLQDVVRTRRVVRRRRVDAGQLYEDSPHATYTPSSSTTDQAATQNNVAQTSTIHSTNNTFGRVQFSLFSRDRVKTSLIRMEDDDSTSSIYEKLVSYFNTDRSTLFPITYKILGCPDTHTIFDLEGLNCYLDEIRGTANFGANVTAWVRQES
jgi:hypothetical protein